MPTGAEATDPEGPSDARVDREGDPAVRVPVTSSAADPDTAVRMALRRSRYEGGCDAVRRGDRAHRLGSPVPDGVQQFVARMGQPTYLGSR